MPTSILHVNSTGAKSGILANGKLLLGFQPKLNQGQNKRKQRADVVQDRNWATHEI